jgi:hypothetical protein
VLDLGHTGKAEEITERCRLWPDCPADNHVHNLPYKSIKKVVRWSCGPLFHNDDVLWHVP